MDVLTIVAAVLLLGMIACWIALPGSSTYEIADAIESGNEELVPALQHG